MGARHPVAHPITGRQRRAFRAVTVRGRVALCCGVIFRLGVNAVSKRKDALMSTLLVLGYPTEEKAKEAYQEVLSLGDDFIVNLQSVAVVARRDNDKFDVVTPGQPIGNSTVWGLFWGMLFGLIFLIPFWGAAIGAGLGALTGFFVKRGVDEDFQDRVRNLLTQKDEAAVFMVVSSMTEDKFAEAMRPFGGDILQTSLSIKDEEELKCELGKC